jgi:UDPglucose 6-dehydrogenase
VGTSRRAIAAIRTARPTLEFSYAYIPENLRLGTAIRSFLDEKRFIVGTDSAAALSRAHEILAGIGGEIVSMSIESAEMAKHAMNAWLALSISFTNDLADLCEAEGADVEQVIGALKSEPRIGQKAYLFAGIGFSGGTLGRDLRALLAAGSQKGVELPVISSILAKNESRTDSLIRRLEKTLGSLNGATIAILGITYKPGTSTLRRSLPLAIESELRKRGALVRLYDPLAIPDEVVHFTDSPFFSDAYTAAEGSRAVLVLTPDRALRELDFKKLASVMRSPVLVDGQNILIAQETAIKESGFIYVSIGR